MALGLTWPRPTPSPTWPTASVRAFTKVVAMLPHACRPRLQRGGATSAPPLGSATVATDSRHPIAAAIQAREHLTVQLPRRHRKLRSTGRPNLTARPASRAAGTSWAGIRAGRLADLPRHRLQVKAPNGRRFRPRPTRGRLRGLCRACRWRPRRGNSSIAYGCTPRPKPSGAGTHVGRGRTRGREACIVTVGSERPPWLRSTGWWEAPSRCSTHPSCSQR